MSPSAIKGGEIGDSIWYAIMGVVLCFVRFKKDEMRPSFVVFMRIFGVAVAVYFTGRTIFLLLN